MQQHPSHAVRRFHPGTRDLWVGNLRRATSWVAAASVGLAAGLVGLAAYETPGHHPTGSTSTGTGSPLGTANPSVPAPGSTAGGTAAPGTTTSGVTSPGVATPGTATPGTGTPGSATSGTRTPGSGTSGAVLGPGSGPAHVSTGLS